MSGDEVLFDAVLEPNRPLHAGGMLLVLGLVGALSIGTALFFLAQGAWPVTPFLGADAALLGWAFFACSRAARRRERLRLTREKLTIERFAADGRCTREELNPYWLQVEHHDPERIGAELALVWRGKRWVIGQFLGAGERASLADALRAALREARTSFA
jgi:uncharacterized membrane protein